MACVYGKYVISKHIIKVGKSLYIQSSVTLVELNRPFKVCTYRLKQLSIETAVRTFDATVYVLGQ